MASPYFFEGTTYWSEGDEQAHFAWLDRIGAITRAYGEGRRVYLDLASDRVGSEDLRELSAVYRRYGGDLEQLKKLKAADAPNP